MSFWMARIYRILALVINLAWVQNLVWVGVRPNSSLGWRGSNILRKSK